MNFNTTHPDITYMENTGHEPDKYRTSTGVYDGLDKYRCTHCGDDVCGDFIHDGICFYCAIGYAQNDKELLEYVEYTGNGEDFKSDIWKYPINRKLKIKMLWDYVTANDTKYRKEKWRDIAEYMNEMEDL